MGFLEWFGVRAAATAQDGDAVHRIARSLDAMEPAADRHLALFAFLLARVANVDQEISAAETSEMERVVEEFGGLSRPQAVLAVEIAKAQERLFGETQNFLAAREFRDTASDAEKVALLRCMFAVSAADDSISVAEEEAIRVVSRELLVTNDEYLAIRAEFRDKRAVFQRS